MIEQTLLVTAEILRAKNAHARIEMKAIASIFSNYYLFFSVVNVRFLPGSYSNNDRKYAGDISSRFNEHTRHWHAAFVITSSHMFVIQPRVELCEEFTKQR